MQSPATEPAKPAAPRIQLGGCLLRLAGCVALGLCGGALFAWIQFRVLAGDDALQEIGFDSARWLDIEASTRADQHFHTLRQAMARDLAEHVLQPGMPHGDVRKLLGPPSRWPLLDAAPWWGPEDEAYFLGKPAGLIARGDDWLWLDFDAQGALVRAKVLDENADREREP